MVVTPGQINRRANFYFQLASLITAGVPIVQALEMTERSASRAYRDWIGVIRDRLAKGATFTEALHATKGWVPIFDLSLIAAGEQSGRLDATMKLLGNHYQEQALLLRRLISSMAYPIFVLHFAVLIFPTRLLTGIFLNNGVEAFVLHKVSILLPLYAIVAAVIFAFQGSHGEKWRALVERITSSLPLVAGARRDLALGRLSGALEALLAAGVPIIRAWELAASASGSPRIEKTLHKVLPQIEAGLTPAEAVRQSSLFPELFQNLYATGETTGQLDTTLHRLHVHYLEEATHKLRNLASWTPKLVFFIVALIVAYQVFSFYSGYFNQLNQLGL